MNADGDAQDTQDATLRSAYSAVVAYGYEGRELRYVARVVSILSIPVAFICG
jgi:hypothetical protein